MIDGSGWGHGVGMSQYGAYGMSKEGHTHGEILKNYYNGVKITKLGTGGTTGSPPIWVNLEMDFTELTLRVDAISGSGHRVRVTRGQKEWFVPVGGTIKVKGPGPTNCWLVINPPGADNTYSTAKGGCAFNFRWYAWKTTAQPKTARRHRRVHASPTGRSSPTVYRECRYARGMLVVRSGEGGLDLSAKLRLNNYILGISEMPYAWGNSGGMAALRAQAIAARSYARELMIHRGNPADNLCAAWCHVRDTTWDQRYVGTGHGQSNWVNAVRQTAGKVMTHSAAPNQDIVRGYYSSSSGGATEDIEDVWPWWDPVPYYESADDHWAVDGTVSNPNASWTVTLSNEEVADAVGLSEITDIWVSKRNTSGSANTISFTDGDTTVTETSAWMRSTFLLKSITFSLSMS